MYMFTIICNMWRGGDQGFAPWSWRILWVSSCWMSNYKTSIIPMCNITTPRRGGGSGGLPPEAEAFSEFLDVRWAISRLFILSYNNTKEGRGSGGLPPEAEAFSEFLDVKWAISRLSSFTMFNITTPRRGGGQGACPLKLKHFLSFLMSRWAISGLSSPSSDQYLRYRPGKEISRSKLSFSSSEEWNKKQKPEPNSRIEWGMK